MSISQSLLYAVPQETEVNGIKFWCYTAGHVLGAAMFMIEIAGVKVSLAGVAVSLANSPALNSVSPMFIYSFLASTRSRAGLNYYYYYYLIDLYSACSI